MWRGVLHEATDQAAMFMPVVKEAIRVRSADEIGPAVARAARDARWPPPVAAGLRGDPDRPAGRRGRLSRGLTPRRTLAARSSRSERPTREQLERALELLERARRPLVWAGGGALQSGAGEAVARLAERLVAPVILTFSAKGLLPPGHPCLVESSPHVPEAGELWDEADLVVAIGSDFDGMMTQGWKQPQPPHLVAINVDAARRLEELPPGRRGRGRRRAGGRRLSRSGSPSAAGSTRSQRRVRDLNARVRARLASEEPEAVAFLDAIEAALPDDAVVVSDMCIPGYWLGRLPPHPGAAQALLSARLGHARLRLPAGPRRRARRTRARR